MLEQLSGLIIHIIQSLGYPGIAFLTGTSATAIPIPIEITLPFSGFLAEQGKLLLPFVILAGVIGDLLGSVIGYSIGFLLEENLLLNLIKKFGKFVLISEHEYYQATGWIKKYGLPFVFIGKMLPGVRSFIAVAAGITEVKFSKFIISNFIATLIYFSFVSYVGFYLGSKWNLLGGYFHKFELVIVVLLIIAVLFYVNYKLKIIKFKKK